MIYRRVATPLVARAMLCALLAATLVKTAQWAGVLPAMSPREIVDFDAFYIAGQMAWRGDIIDAYHFPKLIQAQITLGGSESFMPWTYPPPFNLLAACLATVPAWLAYLLFVGLTLSAFLLVLRRLSGPMFPAVVFAVFPALATVIACGQNGFLTGAFVGLFCLAGLRGRAIAGIPLGLMVIKPHLAVTLAAHVVLSRQWGCVLAAAAVVAGSALAATLAFGFAIWPAFLQGVREAGEFLVAGYYPLFRMVSVYAALRSVDAAPSIAMLAQAISALVALSLVAASLRSRMPTRQTLGVAALCSLLVSPYAYDYDLSLYAVALALLMEDLLRRTSDREQIVLFALSWLACGYGLLANLAGNPLTGAASRMNEATTDLPASIGGPVLLLLVALIWRILRRSEARIQVDPSPDPSPEPALDPALPRPC